MAKRVLVVDDDHGMREILVAALELDGYDVKVAPNGLAALEVFDDALPDIVVLDLMMPKMDGFQFVAELGKRGLRGQVRILVLTADGRAREKAARVGAEAWLTKPFALAEFLERVETLVAAE